MDKSVFYYIGTIVALVLLLIIGAVTSGGSDSGSHRTRKETIKTVECQVCNNKYQEGSENAKSIRKTNMCLRCYENFKFANDVLKELPVN